MDLTPEKAETAQEIVKVVREECFDETDTSALLEFCTQNPLIELQDGVSLAAKYPAVSLGRKQHYVYDVLFTSVTAIGLNLTVKQRSVEIGGRVEKDNVVIVDSFAPGFYPVKKLGFVNAKDVIVSAAVPGKFLRRIQDTKTLIHFLRTCGRPVFIRFRRKPARILFEDVVATEDKGLQESFWRYLKHGYSGPGERGPVRKLSPRKTSNVKEALRKTKSRLMSLGRSSTNLTDTEEESSEEESLSPGKRNPEEGEETPLVFNPGRLAQLAYLFTLEVEQLKKCDFEVSDASEEQLSKCSQLSEQVVTRFLTRNSPESILGCLVKEEYRLRSPSSDKVFRLLKEHEALITSCSETRSKEEISEAIMANQADVSKGSENAAKILDNDVCRSFLAEVLVPLQTIALSLLKTEVFPSFLETTAGQNLADKLSSEQAQTSTSTPIISTVSTSIPTPRSTTPDVIFSRFLPRAIWRTNRKAANCLLFHFAASGQKEKVRTLYIEQWIQLAYETDGGIVAKAVDAATRLVCSIESFDTSAADVEGLKDTLESLIFDNGFAQFYVSALGEFLLEAYDDVCMEGHPEKFETKIPRLSQVLSLCGGQEQLVVHRRDAVRAQVESGAGLSGRLSDLRHVVLFTVKDDSLPGLNEFICVLGARTIAADGEAKEGELPVHAEKFFVPFGSEEQQGWKPFAFNFCLATPNGENIQGACAITYTPDKTSPDSKRVGICILSSETEPTVPQKLRYVLSRFADERVGFREYQWDPRKTIEEDLKLLIKLCREDLISDTLTGSCRSSASHLKLLSTEHIETVDFELMHACLSVDNIFRVFEMCLLEQKILFVSSYYSVSI